MGIVVQKYGGSSLASPRHIKQVARRVVEEKKAGNQVVVVVSALGDTTDHLIQLATQVSRKPPEREMDMLLSVGERISIALLAMAIHDLGYDAISFTGSQVGIITDNKHTEARILEVRANRLLDELEKGRVVIVAGFQGVSINKEITTLGRGGSDTTAIALAAALKADRCEIMKDVDGVYIADPKLIPQMRFNDTISYEEMIEMANMGAGVLKAEAIEIARAHKIKIGVGSSSTGKIGTIITDRSMESSGISGIVGEKELVLLRINLPDVQNQYRINDLFAQKRIKSQAYILSRENMTILFEARHLKDVEKILNNFSESNSPINHQFEKEKGIVALIGTGLNFNSELSLRVFRVLEQSGITPELLQVSPLRISWVMPQSQIDGTIRMLYQNLVEPK